MMKIFCIVFSFFISLLSAAQYNEDSLLDFQQKLNEHYSNPETSPLLKDDLAAFESLDFFQPDSVYYIKAKFVRTPNEKPFEMPTSTQRKPLYIKYAELHFRFNGIAHQLDVFQNVEMARMPLYRNSLFLPFTDLTSGVTTYGGGRYIDLEIPREDEVYIDFNKAYNPYCAYNHEYSCPIPPESNDLAFEVKAGVKYNAKE